MTKKNGNQITNTNTNTNIVNVNIPERKKATSKNIKKPNWIAKAIVLALIGLIVSCILIFLEHSTATNGKPAFIQSPSSPSETK